MTDEKLMNRYNIIEGRWLSSHLCEDLTKAIKKNLEGTDLKILSSILFGTGSMSGLRDGWIYRPDVALYQVAAFKTVVDTIGQRCSKGLLIRC